MCAKQADLGRIQLLIMDVDGVLTDGGIIIHSDGTESKRFNVMDGQRVMLWHRAGLDSAILSGRQTAATTIRAEQLGIKYVLQGCKQKLPAFEQLLKDTEYTPEQTAYIGDDWLDLPLLRRVGFAAVPAQGVEDIKPYAHYVTRAAGGDGAVAEVIEYILRQTGRWEQSIERYLE
ncbi:MAG: HAD-IIIA family hydrolase [Sedimentisphaerales bacterium]|nr:HAD-IIIA family hydrolase [Sedimentisphaerales bacterium]